MAESREKKVSQMRSRSIGESGFADKFAAGQKAAANGEGTIAAEADDDDMPEFLKGHEFGLKPAPVATQFAGDEDDEGDEDDAKEAEIKEKHKDLQSKTFAMKALLERRAAIKDTPDPFMLLLEQHDKTMNTEEGERKKEEIHMYNAIVDLFEAARKNEDLRDFVTNLFTAQQSYYKNSHEKKIINSELRIIGKLYNEQEMEQTMAKLKATSEARMRALTEKADAKAKKKEEAASAKKQKTGGDSRFAP
jgi:hypothetical protein